MNIVLPEFSSSLEQNEEFFHLESENNRKIYLHDYSSIFAVEGLYEEIMHNHLGCTSPSVMAGLILSHLRNYDTPLKDINVLEIAPGNGCLGALLNSYNVSNIIGIDNNTAAKEASLRDYPTVYKEYLVSDDITQLASDDKKHPDFDCIICCSALDFNHVNLDSLLLLFDKKLKPGGICAVNIRNSDIPGCIKNTFFKRLAELEESDALQVATNFEYVHRADVYGNPIDYLAVVLRKTK